MNGKSKVPFGAQVVFCIQHTLFLVMAVLFAALLPIWWGWSKLHVSGAVFLSEVLDVMKDRHARMKAHRDRLAAMYRDGA